MKALSLIILLLQSWICSSQTVDAKRDYQWIFGYPFYANGVILDFNASPSTYKAFPKKLVRDMSIANANICDVDGNIQLFTNGCDINNRDFELVQNGDSINKSNIFNEICDRAGIPFVQITLILPKKEQQYYVFYKNAEDLKDVNGGLFTSTNKLLYSIVDFKSDPKGVVLQKDKLLSPDTMIHGELSACRHANGVDWWLVDWLWNGSKDSTYRSFLVKPDTILGPFKAQIGRSMTRNSAQDQAVFSPDGTRYARIRYRDGVHLFDFDRSEGKFSNYKFLPLNNSKVLFTGVNFSPNSKLLYATIAEHILQYDLEAPNIAATRDTVAVYDGFTDFFQTKFCYIYLGPDCKLYVGPQNTVRYLSVINFPNRRGKDCDVAQHAIKLPTIVDLTLPNYPNFRLGAVGDNFAPCDSTINPVITGLNDDLLSEEGRKIGVAVYPNPVGDQISVDLFGYVGDFAEGFWRLVDLSGRSMLQYPIFPNHSEYVYDITAIPNGMYVWQLWLDGKAMRAGKLVVQKE